MERRKHRPGEMEALYFDKMPQRCKEMFFEFLSYGFPCDVSDKATFVDIYTLYNEECKSPIEQIFSLAFDIVYFSKNLDLKTNIYLWPQVDIHINNKHYVADFYFDTDEIGDIDAKEKFNPLKLVIECDGHETHNSTKAQVAKDNRRDYDLKMAGYEVLHFSGSQIYNEPFKCAEETLDFIVSRIVK